MDIIENKNGANSNPVSILNSEGMGFEPTVELPPHDPSKIAPSTTRTSLFVVG